MTFASYLLPSPATTSLCLSRYSTHIFSYLLSAMTSVVSFIKVFTIAVLLGRFAPSTMAWELKIPCHYSKGHWHCHHYKDQPPSPSSKAGPGSSAQKAQPWLPRPYKLPPLLANPPSRSRVPSPSTSLAPLAPPPLPAIVPSPSKSSPPQPSLPRSHISSPSPAPSPVKPPHHSHAHHAHAHHSHTHHAPSPAPNSAKAPHMMRQYSPSPSPVHHPQLQTPSSHAVAPSARKPCHDQSPTTAPTTPTSSSSSTSIVIINNPPEAEEMSDHITAPAPAPYSTLVPAAKTPELPVTMQTGHAQGLALPSTCRLFLILTLIIFISLLV